MEKKEEENRVAEMVAFRKTVLKMGIEPGSVVQYHKREKRPPEKLAGYRPMDLR